MSFEGFLSLTEAIHIDGDEPEIEKDLDSQEHLREQEKQILLTILRQETLYSMCRAPPIQLKEKRNLAYRQKNLVQSRQIRKDDTIEP